MTTTTQTQTQTQTSDPISTLIAHERSADHAIDPRFMQRWSPRAFSARSIPKDVLDRMFEAARWAPSSYNLQPWRFFVATDGADRTRFDAPIMAFNRAWSDRAAAIVYVVADTHNPHNDQTNGHAWFDTGAATQNLVLEAQRHGVYAHAMGGIDGAATHEMLQLAPHEEVVCAIALGYRAAPEVLPASLRERETPSERHPMASFVTYGSRD